MQKLLLFLTFAFIACTSNTSAMDDKISFKSDLTNETESPKKSVTWSSVKQIREHLSLDQITNTEKFDVWGGANKYEEEKNRKEYQEEMIKEFGSDYLIEKQRNDKKHVQEMLRLVNPQTKGSLRRSPTFQSSLNALLETPNMLSETPATPSTKGIDQKKSVSSHLQSSSSLAFFAKASLIVTAIVILAYSFDGENIQSTELNTM